MSDYGGPERRRSSPTPEQMLSAITTLSEKYETSAKSNRDLAKEVGRRKREARYIALGVVLVVVVAVCSLLVVRHHDRDTEQERRERLAAQIITQRENLIAGCERGNESRRADRETIEIAYEPAPIPAGLPPELEALIRQSQERSAAKRAELLSRPGVQIIDCQAAYPPPDLDR